MELVLLIVEKALPNENELNTYMLNKKYNLINKKRNSGMLIKWKNM